MSVNDLSNTALKHILNNISGNIELNRELLQTAIDKVNKTTRFAKLEVKKTELTTRGTRLITDSLQDGILTKDAARLLSEQFRDMKNLKTRSSTIIPKKAVTSKTIINAFIGKTSLVSNLNKYVTEKLKPLGRYEKKGNAENFLAGYDSVMQDLANQASAIFARDTLVQDFSTFLNVQSSRGGSTVILQGLSHGEFNSLFLEFLKKSLNTPPYLVEFINANIDAGHLLGLFTVRIAGIFSGSSSENVQINLNDGIPTITFDTFQNPDKYEKEINRLFTQSAQLSLNADSISSNLINDLQALVNVSRQNFVGTMSGKSPGAVAEIQLSILNQQAGQALTQTALKMKRLSELALATNTIESGSSEEAEIKNTIVQYFQSFKTLANYIDKVAKELSSPAFKNQVKQDLVQKIKVQSEQIAQALLASKGSDTFFESIEKGYAAILAGTVYKGQKTDATAKSKKVAKTVKNQNVSATSGNIKSKKVSLTPKPVKVRTPQLRTTRGQFFSLASLQRLLDASLVQRVKDNMGTGRRRDILNLRDGTFAESVKVERLSQSREGMITAFYNYMKYPYATFSKGGVQEFPTSRDPKLLIAKSIREIGATMVANRMRAVLV